MLPNTPAEHMKLPDTNLWRLERKKKTEKICARLTFVIVSLSYVIGSEWHERRAVSGGMRHGARGGTSPGKQTGEGNEERGSVRPTYMGPLHLAPLPKIAYPSQVHKLPCWAQRAYTLPGVGRKKKRK